MPEKASPELKLRRPSSPLALCISFESGLAVEMLVPIDNEESSWPSMSPSWKSTAMAEPIMQLKGSRR